MRLIIKDLINIRRCFLGVIEQVFKFDPQEKITWWLMYENCEFNQINHLKAIELRLEAASEFTFVF